MKQSSRGLGQMLAVVIPREGGGPRAASRHRRLLWRAAELAATLLVVASAAQMIPGTPAKVMASTSFNTEADRVIAAARQHIGQPYKSGAWGGYRMSGTSVVGGVQRKDNPKGAVDCKGFVWIVLRETNHAGVTSGSNRRVNGTGPSNVEALFRQVKSAEGLIDDLTPNPFEAFAVGHEATLAGLMPGDLVFYGTRYLYRSEAEYGARGDILADINSRAHAGTLTNYQRREMFHHVAIYIGNGKVIHSGGGGVRDNITWNKIIHVDEAPPHAQTFYKINFVIHMGLSDTPALNDKPFPQAPVGAGEPCKSVTNPGTALIDGNRCPTLFSTAPTGQVWAHPVNGSSTGNVPVYVQSDGENGYCAGAGTLSLRGAQWCEMRVTPGEAAIWASRDLNDDGRPELLTLDHDTLRLFKGVGGDALHGLVSSPISLGTFTGVRQIVTGRFSQRQPQILVIPVGTSQASMLYTLDVTASQLVGDPQPWRALGQYADVASAGDLYGSGYDDLIARPSGSDTLYLLSGLTDTAEMCTYPSGVDPVRVMSLGAGIAPLGPGTQRVFPLLKQSQGRVPAGAQAVVMNIGAKKPGAAGLFKVAPTLSDLSQGTYALLFEKDAWASANFNAKLDASGQIALAHTGRDGSKAGRDMGMTIWGYYDDTSTGGTTYHSLDAPETLSATAPGGRWVSLPLPSRLWGAGAVTGTITITDSSGAGSVAIQGGPSTTSPNFSSIDFGLHEKRSNDFTVGVSLYKGELKVRYNGSSSKWAKVVVKVTGYYSADATGSKYNPLTPKTILDTGAGLGLPAPLRAAQPAGFQVAGMGGVPVGAVAVTGTLTIKSTASAGYVSASTGSSTSVQSVRFREGYPVANGITAKLDGNGKLWLTYVPDSGSSSAQASALFDVTGYYSSSGSWYHAFMTPQVLATNTALVPDMVAVAETGALYRTPGGCALPYALGSRNDWSSTLSNADYFPVGYVADPPDGSDPGGSDLEALPVGIPAVWQGASLDVAYELAGASDESGVAVVHLWAHHRDAETGLWSPWREAGSAEASYADEAWEAPAIGLTFGEGDGLYEIATMTDEGVPDLAEASVYVDTRGTVASSVAAFSEDYTASSSLSVGYGVAPDADGVGPTKVELYERFKPVGGSFGGWTLAGTATGSYSDPFELSGLQDGVYEFYTYAYGAADYVETKAQADASIRVNATGSPMSWVDDSVIGVSANPTLSVAYRYVPSADEAPPATVELYQRFKPVGESFGSWALAGTITDDVGTPFSVTVATDGTYEFYTRAYDASGAAEAKSAADSSVIVDQAAGESSIAGLPATTTAQPTVVEFDAHEPAGTSGTAWADLYYRYKANSSASWPDEWTKFTASEDTTDGFSFDFASGPGYYQFYTAVADKAGNVEPAPSATTSPKASTKFDPAMAGGTFYPLATPQRVVASKANIGITGALTWLQPRTFQVAGVMGIPADATAITGTLTTTDPTAENVVILGPAIDNNPTISSINFGATGNFSAGFTSALAPGGTLNVVLGGPNSSGTVQVIVDVTGYFRTAQDGATYYASATPQRIVDSRKNIGITNGLSAGVVKSFQVTGKGGVPSNATAVTASLTVTGQTQYGWLALGPTSTTTPNWATLFFSTTTVAYATSVTTKLGPTGQLYIVYMASAGRTANVIFDITGYFVPGTGGARYVGLQAPNRLVDTRDPTNLPGKLSWLVPQTFQVTGWGGVPAYAIAVSGNPTVTRQNAVGVLIIEPTANASPGWSTSTFAATGNIGVGVTSALGEGGTLSVMCGGGYSTLTTDFLFDVTGYFVNPVP